MMQQSLSPYNSHRQPLLTPHRDAWVEIDLGAVEHNARLLKAQLPAGCEAMAVVKSDAYGHGAGMISPIVEACGFQWLGVASIDEALELRQAGVRLPLLVLGASPDWAMPVAAAENITLTVFHPRQLAALLQLETPPQVQLKVDTGMHRLGVAPQEAVALYAALLAAKLPCVGIFSHLATAESDESWQRQWGVFQQVLKGITDRGLPLPTWVHLANTVGSTHPALLQTPCNLARFGIGLYGFLPTPESQLPLRPVMSLKARIVHLQTIAVGEGVSYGQAWVSKRPSTIATLPLGYADGLPRGLSGRIEVYYQGRLVPQVGRITMDQVLLDVTDCPNPQVGDVVSFLWNEGVPKTWASQLSLSRWAIELGTIEYELLCGLRVRLPRIYTRSS